MSMLTPPGMGGKRYRVTGDVYPRMRRPRRRRRILAGLATVALLGLLGYGTLQLVDVFTQNSSDAQVTAATGDAPGPASGPRARETNPATGQSGQCRPGKLPEPEKITVNVYNATIRTGLAQRIADTLESRGFRIGDVDNAPQDLDGKVTGPGLLLGPPADTSGALTVLGAHLTGAESREADRGSGAAPRTVDLVLGRGFRSLTAPSDAARRLADRAARNGC